MSRHLRRHLRPHIRTRRDRDRGSLTPFFVVIAPALFAVVGLGVDGGRMLATRGVVASASAAAASAAASASPTTVLAAVEAVETANGTKLVSMASNAAGQFCVTSSLTRPTWVLGIVGIDQFTAKVTECAS